MIYPRYPDTFWSFKHALKFIAKKAAVPPLGLITVSAMFPENWNKKLVDLNVAPLKQKDMEWADYVFTSAMYVHKESVDYILSECQKNNVKIVAGGPLFTQEYNNYPQVDHFILNEAEITFPMFLNDLENGGQPRRLYQTEEYADINMSPVPDYHLLDMKSYAFMNLQVTRGCPFNCDFCEITALLGHKVRMKDTRKILEELDALEKLKWRGPVFIVDDNFIGKKKEVKYDLLPAMKKWGMEHKFPFSYNTQMSINIADDDDLLNLMINAGVRSTFIGIETPEAESLKECNKVQNEGRDLVQNVKKLQNAGMQVSGGFIVGFDSDTTSVFQRQIDFIRQSGIVSAMVGMLNAPRNTRLYNRLASENRLTTESTGNNTDMTMNFTPKMNGNELLKGYHEIIHGIYSIKPFYQRLRSFLMNYKPRPIGNKKLRLTELIAFAKSILIIGVLNKGRTEYWKFLAWALAHHPASFVDAITFTVYGYHFRTIYGLRGNNKNTLNFKK
jgi:radical SAM superfamily enzyme YgiQ (UPF0313 family)